METTTYIKLVDEKNKELVNRLPPFSIAEIKEAKDLADVIDIVYGSRPTLESIIYEARLDRKET